MKLFVARIPNTHARVSELWHVSAVLRSMDGFCHLHDFFGVLKLDLPQVHEKTSLEKEVDSSACSDLALGQESVVHEVLIWHRWAECVVQMLRADCTVHGKIPVG